MGITCKCYKPCESLLGIFSGFLCFCEMSDALVRNNAKQKLNQASAFPNENDVTHQRTNGVPGIFPA